MLAALALATVPMRSSAAESLLGVFGENSMQRVLDFEAWLGRPVDVILCTIDFHKWENYRYANWLSQDVYGARGQNFLRTALRLAPERDELRIVNDQFGSPTPARWLAAMTALSLVKRPEAEGTWHVVADGECSWHEFAMAIYGDALVAGLIARAPKLIGIPSSEYPTKARRPGYSRLDTSKFERDFDLHLADWRVGLREVIGEIAEANAA